MISKKSRYRGAILLGTFFLFISNYSAASLFEGETLDAVADGASWVILFLAPTIAIAVFLLIHILPEKIAEKKQHPQAKAIQCLCLLSLFFGGLLWPLAWLWAYTKPVLHQLAYGTDKVAPDHGGDKGQAAIEAASDNQSPDEIQQLRQRIAELESALAKQASTRQDSNNSNDSV